MIPYLYNQKDKVIIINIMAVILPGTYVRIAGAIGSEGPFRGAGAEVLMDQVPLLIREYGIRNTVL